MKSSYKICRFTFSLPSISEMQVGPVNRERQEVVIISQPKGTMGDGLLGMSFLAGLKYTIDFQKQRLNWMP